MPYECKLSPELQKYAKDVLNEDPARRDADIEHIRKWINKQPHLNARTDDLFILRFLRGCKFSLEKTKKKIDAHYTIKSMVPEWFEGRDPHDKKLREVLELGFMLILPGLDNKNRRVSLTRNGIMDPHKHHPNDVMRALYMLIDVYLEEEEIASITGGCYVADMTGFSASHMLAFPMTMIKKSTVLYQDGYALRPQGMHYINTSSAFESLFSIFKNFLNDKMRKRLIVHPAGDLSSLYKEIPQEMMPKEYGGQVDIQEVIDHWIKRVDARRDWLLEDSKYGVDESKRPGKPKTSTDLFGIDGSFRKLDVD